VFYCVGRRARSPGSSRYRGYGEKVESRVPVDRLLALDWRRMYLGPLDLFPVVKFLEEQVDKGSALFQSQSTTCDRLVGIVYLVLLVPIVGF